MVILGPTYYHCVSQEKNSFKYVKRTKSVSFDFFLEYPSLLEKKKKQESKLCFSDKQCFYLEYERFSSYD